MKKATNEIANREELEKKRRLIKLATLKRNVSLNKVRIDKWICRLIDSFISLKGLESL